MSYHRLFIVRGLPGAGKSSAARDIACSGESPIFAADDFFNDARGNYVYDRTKLCEAHGHCFKRVIEAMDSGWFKSVIVEGTFTQRWEAKSYFNIAKERGWQVVIIDVGDGGCTDEELAARNIHGVQLQKIAEMRTRWEFNIWQ